MKACDWKPLLYSSTPPHACQSDHDQSPRPSDAHRAQPSPTGDAPPPTAPGDSRTRPATRFHPPSVRRASSRRRPGNWQRRRHTVGPFHPLQQVTVAGQQPPPRLNPRRRHIDVQIVEEGSAEFALVTILAQQFRVNPQTQRAGSQSATPSPWCADPASQSKARFRDRAQGYGRPGP